MNDFLQKLFGLLVLIVVATIIYNLLVHGNITDALAKDSTNLIIGETKSLEGR